MSGTKHTPGPWRTGDMFNTVFGPPNGQPAPEVIATVRKGNKANARLIAAAPELLEIVSALHKWFEEAGYNGNGPSGCSLLFDDDNETLGAHIRSAIAKVEGSK